MYDQGEDGDISMIELSATWQTRENYVEKNLVIPHTEQDKGMSLRKTVFRISEWVVVLNSLNRGACSCVLMYIIKAITQFTTQDGHNYIHKWRKLICLRTSFEWFKFNSTFLI